MKLRRLSLVALVLAGTGCSALFGPLPDQEAKPLALRSQIRSSDGTLLATLFEENRTPVAASDIPQVVRDAVVAVEDARFWDHSGVDAKAIARAALTNWAKGETVQGGSTITQQLAKLMYFPGDERTFKIKLTEARVALRLERDHSKDEILTMYLNRAYFGSGAYGIAAAAETFFRTRPMNLTISQSALLAGLIRTPGSMNPFDQPEAALARRAHVLQRMRQEGLITQAEESAANKEPLGLTKRRPPLGTLHYPYFVEFVKQQVLADPAFGATEAERASALFRGGLQITTTLDRRLQEYAEEAVASVLDQPGDPDAALVAIDPKTGAVKAMVGGRKFNTEQFNLAYQGRRQSGSAFKPFVLAAALEAGIRPDARYQSHPATLRYGPGDSLSWRVNNYDGRGRGTITLREGMVNSVNGVYARLVLDVGPSKVVDVAHRLGIETELDPLPSIALGGLRLGVSPFEMASAYSTFANLGVHMPGHGVARAIGPDGETVFDDDALKGERAIDPGIAYTMNDVLQDVVERGTGRRAQIGRPLAGKTGTTQEYHDAWFVGYTPDLVTAIWVGYRKAQISMRNVRGITVVGGSFPSQIFRAFMNPALDGVPEHEFEIPRESFVSVVLGFSRDCLARIGQSGVEVSLPASLIPARDCPAYTAPKPSPKPSPKPTGSAEPAPSPTPTEPDPGPEPVPTPT
ncbi:MAG TPA: PBP1A family penicillin-binding protein [Actinomycetota bacterium]|nr:PBP1A family penicillin-binding protein [Actinomycetota bacterium]